MENNEIKVLRGPDRVRKRPGVIFTSDDIEGASYAVKTLLDVFITEASLGFSKELSVKIRKDNSICIVSYDRGLYLDETIVDGRPIWEYDFCELYAAPKEDNKEKYHFSVCEEKNHNELFGFPDLPAPKYCSGNGWYTIDLCCVQYVSEFMIVESVHDNTQKKVFFKKGHIASELFSKPSICNTYTKIEFKLDSDVFSNIVIPFDVISTILRNSSITVPGLKCSITDERTQEKNIYLFPNGILDYAKSLDNCICKVPVFQKELEASGKDRYNRTEYDARVKVVLGFSSNSSFTECFHNFSVLPYGGNHLKSSIQKINGILDWRLRRLENQGDKTLGNNCFLILETNCTNKATSWENATKKAITNKMIADMCEDLFNDDFSYYIEKNKEAILSIIDGKMN